MNPTLILPPLDLESWQPTRDVLWGYARCMGAIRRALARPARHWSHTSLAVGTRGLTTGPMDNAGERFSLRLDIRQGQFVLDSETGQAWAGGVPATKPKEILDRVNAWMVRREVGSRIDIELPDVGGLDAYDQSAADRYWSVLSRVDGVLAEFAGQLRGETFGPQLWPHHFDLAVLWLSGRQVSGEDPGDEEAADESMNFGFSTGDEGIPNPYFYATAYPKLDEPSGLELTSGARWQVEGWHGARMDYADLAAAADSRAALLAFLSSVQRAGAEAMRARAPLD